MPELSHYIFENLIDKSFVRDISFENLRDKTFELTQSWLINNPEKMEKIEENFCFYTDQDFYTSKPAIIRGISDHYADKIALVSFSFEKIRKMFEEVIYSDNEIKSVKEDLKDGFNVVLVGSHFGGIEWSAAILSITGLPCAIVANFKTEEARQKAFEQSRFFGVDVIDINNDNRKYFKGLMERPKCVITVMDAFDRWYISDDSKETEIFGEKVLLDCRIDYFASKIKSKVYWLALKPDRNRNFEIEMKKIEPENGSCIKGLVNHWKRIVKSMPESLYNWDEISELMNHKRVKV